MLTDWRLSYSGTDLALGSVASRYVFPTAPSVGPPETSNDDARLPRADGVAFGADYLSGRTIGLEIDVDGEDEQHTRSLLARLRHAWRADAIRSTPGAVAELTTHTGRSVFGRPRRFQSNDAAIFQGSSAVTADFVTADDLFYGPEQSTGVGLVPALGGGLVAPLTAPLSTTASSNRRTGFSVGGDVPTPIAFEVTGPITNPVVEIVGVARFEFRLTLAHDETLAVDARPWVRSILRNGASAAGALSPTSTRLSRALLPPGDYELVLRGASNTGTARVGLRWRDAYTTP